MLQQYSRLQLGQRRARMDVSTALPCVLPYNGDRELGWVLLPPIDLVLGTMACQKAIFMGIAGEHIDDNTFLMQGSLNSN